MELKTIFIKQMAYQVLMQQKWVTCIQNINSLNMSFLCKDKSIQHSLVN